jgi:hypothetical protein
VAISLHVELPHSLIEGASELIHLIVGGRREGGNYPLKRENRLIKKAASGYNPERRNNIEAPS